jgi:hypothetical protein
VRGGKVPGVIMDTDQGSEYTPVRFRRRVSLWASARRNTTKTAGTRHWACPVDYELALAGKDAA